MCWSGEASVVLATAGFGAAGYCAYKGESPVIWVTLAYFSMMEALQAFTYSVVNQCALPANQVATILGYLHIAFQPFFINALSMYFIPESVRKSIQLPVYVLCFAATIILLIQLYPFDWAGLCAPDRPLCEKTLCSVSGTWHIAWNIPVNGIGNGWPDLPSGMFIGHGGYLSYMAAAFILPVIYGSWRFTAFHALLGPGLAMFLSSNINERPAIWCLLAIGILLIAVITPLRRLMYVQRWLFYPKID